MDGNLNWTDLVFAIEYYRGIAEKQAPGSPEWRSIMEEVWKLEGLAKTQSEEIDSFVADALDFDFGV